MRVAILFINIGFYHAARLRAAFSACREKGWDLAALQLTDSALYHSWGDLGGDLGFPVTTLVPRSEWKRPDGLPAVPRAALGTFFDSFRPDIVFIPGWFFELSKLALRECRKRGIPAIVMSESKRDDAPRTWLKERLKSALYARNFSGALVGGESHARYAEELGIPGDRILAGYDVVDNGFFRDKADRARADVPRARGENPSIPSRPYFISASRFIQRKNIDGLLSAYEIYRKTAKAPLWDLVICGNGEMEDRLKKSAEERGMSQFVHFPGFLPYSVMGDWYGLAGAFIHPALQEQWGLVINEACAAGLPLLCSRTAGACPYLLKDGVNGFSFAPEDIEGMAEAMSSIAAMDGPARTAFGDASRKIVSENFEPSEFGRAVVALAEKVRADAAASGAFRVITVFGRQIAAVPEGEERLFFRLLERLNKNSIRRMGLWLVLSVIVRLGLVRAVFALRRSLRVGGREFDVGAWLNEVRSKLGDATLLPLFVFPPQRGRGRCYAYLYGRSGTCKAFVKIGTDQYNAACLKNERDALLAVTDIPATFKTPKMIGENFAGPLTYIVYEPISRAFRAIKDDWYGLPFRYRNEIIGLVSGSALSGNAWWKEFLSARADIPRAFFRSITSSPPAVLLSGRVHGDLTANNIYRVGEDVYIFDWEYSDAAAPYSVDEFSFYLSHYHALVRRSPLAAFRRILSDMTAGCPPDVAQERALNARYALAYLMLRGSAEARLIGEAWSGEAYRDKFTAAGTAAAYDAGEYGGRSVGGLLWEMEKSILPDIVAKYADNGGRYLDFACGTGRILSFMEELFQEAAGVDISSEMLALAASKVRKARLIEADILSDESAAGSGYDLITAFRFFSNLEPGERVNYLRALASILRKGGSLVVNTHTNPFSYKAAAMWWHMLKKAVGFGMHTRYLTAAELSEMAVRSGLRLKEVIGYGFIPGRLLRFIPWGMALKMERALFKVPFLRPFGVNQIMVFSKD